MKHKMNKQLKHCITPICLYGYKYSHYDRSDKVKTYAGLKVQVLIMLSDLCLIVQCEKLRIVLLLQLKSFCRLLSKIKGLRDYQKYDIDKFKI